MRAIVSEIEDNGVVCNAQVLQFFQQLSDMHVVFHHTVTVLVLTGNAAEFVFDVGAEMHASPAPPEKEGLFSFVLPVNEVNGCIGGLIVNSFHALFRQRTRIFDFAIGIGMNDTAWAEFFSEIRILLGVRIVRQFRLFLRIEVIEVPEEFVEPMIGRQMLILITKMIFAKLSCGISHEFQHFSDGGIFRFEPKLCAGQSDFTEPRTKHTLARNNR